MVPADASWAGIALTALGIALASGCGDDDDTTVTE